MWSFTEYLSWKGRTAIRKTSSVRSFRFCWKRMNLLVSIIFREIASNPTTAQIPCEFCHEFLPADQFQAHEVICIWLWISPYAYSYYQIVELFYQQQNYSFANAIVAFWNNRKRYSFECIFSVKKRMFTTTYTASVSFDKPR